MDCESMGLLIWLSKYEGSFFIKILREIYIRFSFSLFFFVILRWRVQKYGG